MADVWQYLTGRCDDSCSCSSHFYWWNTDWMYEYCLSFTGCCDRSIVLWLYMSSCIKLTFLALGVSTTKYLQYKLNQLTGHRHIRTHTYALAVHVQYIGLHSKTNGHNRSRESAVKVSETAAIGERSPYILNTAVQTCGQPCSFGCIDSHCKQDQ